MGLVALRQPEGIGNVVGVDSKQEGFLGLEVVLRMAGTVAAADIEIVEAEDEVADHSVKEVAGADCLVILD